MINSTAGKPCFVRRQVFVVEGVGDAGNGFGGTTQFGATGRAALVLQAPIVHRGLRQLGPLGRGTGSAPAASRLAARTLRTAEPRGPSLR